MPAQPHETLPPVRLPSEAELARDALSAPLFAAAVRLARWAGAGTRVDDAGELPPARLPEAAAALGLDPQDPDAGAHASRAWRVALDTGLVELTGGPDGAGVADPDGTGHGGADGTGTGHDGAMGAGTGRSGAGGTGTGHAETAGGAPHATAAAGEDLALVIGGAPADVLGLWLAACDAVLADAAVPDLGGLVDALDEGGAIDFDRLDWNPQREADLLDAVLADLYLLTAAGRSTAGGTVPLPVLAASVAAPGGIDRPGPAVLERVADALMRLDGQFRQLEPIGLVEFRPVDEAALLSPDDEDPAVGAEAGAPGGRTALDPEDVSRYGTVRLTPLGLYGIRARLLEAGVAAPAVGELAGKGADALLDAVCAYPEPAAEAEIRQWLDARELPSAAAELLDAARGADLGGPLRRLRCQQALAVAGPQAEPAVRAVLDDPELGGLARVWLAELGAADVPAPDGALVYWLAVDTIAAQLGGPGGADEAEELPLLMESLTAHHAGFFDRAWRVEHPATAEVLEAMGRLHPDRQAAKQARKAAYKARSRPR
ncbi:MULTISPECIES: hypothetical protein [Streptomyces]|uniref:hypothetical protein n=1 Tax=Streptomyces TaxID=1883 RepID=UPI00167AD971|nr:MULTISPECIES: hypothetical protein [Streptomyces]MBD3578958.1 hypothetical protein [Streptomyces sp. KD18]GGT26737.1 hypothetical protein GCM10010286_60000 [Streptomyces toxytricini]